jgi:YVTN family beta-propeller protein
MFKATLARPIVLICALGLLTSAYGVWTVGRFDQFPGIQSAAAVDPLNNRFYVVYGQDHFVYDGATGALLRRHVLPRGNFTGLGVDALANRACVLSLNGIKAFDADTVTQVFVGNLTAMGINPLTRRAWVLAGPVSDSTLLYSVDLVTADTAVADRLPGVAIGRLAIDPVGDRVYVPTTNPGPEPGFWSYDVATRAVNRRRTPCLPGSFAFSPEYDEMATAGPPSEYDSVSFIGIYSGPAAELVNLATERDTVSWLNLDLTCKTGPGAFYMAARWQDGGGEDERSLVQFYRVGTTSRLLGAEHGGRVLVDPRTGVMHRGLDFGSFAVTFNPATGCYYLQDGRIVEDWDNPTRSMAVGIGPSAVAVNPVSGRCYVANATDGTVTVIADTAVAATVLVGSQPAAVAVNPVTNRVYVANAGDNTVTVIDGQTNATTTVRVAASPRAVAVNPATNRIYVASGATNRVTIIAGATNDTTGFPTREVPGAILAWPPTDQVCVTDGPSHITIYEAATGDTVMVPVGNSPCALTVNPVGTLYVANRLGNSVTAIELASHASRTIPVGMMPRDLTWCGATNEVFVADPGSDSVTVINCRSDSTRNLAVGAGVDRVLYDPVKGRLALWNSTADSLTILDPRSGGTTQVPVPGPGGIAVNPVTNQTYAVDQAGNRVTIVAGIRPRQSFTSPMATIDGGAVHTTGRPLITGGASGHRVVCVAARRTPALTGGLAILTSGQGQDSATWSWDWGTDSLPFGESYLQVTAFDACIASNTGVHDGIPRSGLPVTQAVYRVASPSAINGPVRPEPTHPCAIRVRPNPAAGCVTVTCNLGRAGVIDLGVYGIDGRRVRTLARGALSATAWRGGWDGTDERGRRAAAGIYVLRLQAGAASTSSTLVLR